MGQGRTVPELPVGLTPRLRLIGQDETSPVWSPECPIPFCIGSSALEEWKDVAEAQCNTRTTSGKTCQGRQLSSAAMRAKLGREYASLFRDRVSVSWPLAMSMQSFSSSFSSDGRTAVQKSDQDNTMGRFAHCAGVYRGQCGLLQHDGLHRSMVSLAVG